MKNGQEPHKPEPYLQNHFRNTSGRHHHSGRDMSNPCLCINLTTGVRIIGFASVLLGIGTLATSSWVLHRAIQQQKNPTLTTATDLLHQVNTFFGGTTGLYDLDVIFRIFISVSATTLAAAFVQFIMSFWLMLASVRGGRYMARIWVIVQVVVLVAIGGGFLCILTNDLEINWPTFIFLVVSGIDFLLLIYFTLVVFTFSYSSSSDTAV